MSSASAARRSSSDTAPDQEAEAAAKGTCGDGGSPTPVVELADATCTEGANLFGGGPPRPDTMSARAPVHTHSNTVSTRPLVTQWASGIPRKMYSRFMPLARHFTRRHEEQKRRLATLISQWPPLAHFGFCIHALC